MAPLLKPIKVSDFPDLQSYQAALATRKAELAGPPAPAEISAPAGIPMPGGIPVPNAPVPIEGPAKPGEASVFGGRMPPTVPTPEKPLIDTSVETAPSGFDGLTDRDKQVEIALAQVQGRELTEEQQRFLITQTLDQQFQGPDISPITGELQAQTDLLKGDLEARKAEQAASREGLIGAEGERLQSEAERQQGIIQRGANLEIQAGQTAFSFQGFGRGTDVARNAQQIQENASERVLQTQRAADLSAELFQRQLEGADEAALQPLKDQIFEIETSSRQLTIDNAVAVAEANASSGTNFVESLNNLMQILPQSQQSSVNSSVSELLGYVSDEFGNPIAVDQEGNPIPLPGEPIKYETFTDEFTGQTYFYDPYNPGDFFSSPSNSFTPTTNAQGQPSSAGTSNSGGMTGASEAVAAQFGNDILKYGANCALFARTIVPNMPSGADSISGRVSGVQKAQENGYGSSDMNFVQIGDAIHTREGSVGHSAVVIGIEGNELILLESNYKAGQITQGRRLDRNDETVIGWIRGDDNPVVGTPLEGNNISIEDQVGGITFTPGQDTQFKSYSKNANFPENIKTGLQQQEFLKEYNQWASQPQNQAYMEDVNRTEGQRVAIGYADRMTHDIQNLADVEDYIVGLNTIKFATQEKLPNWLREPKYKLYRQAASDFIAAILRKESGAVISDDEFARYQDIYFPEAGDSPEVLEQKRRSRELALNSMNVAAGRATGPAFNPADTGALDSFLNQSSDDQLVKDYASKHGVSEGEARELLTRGGYLTQ